MESRLDLIIRFLTHFCDSTEVCNISSASPARVSEQVVHIRESVNRYFMSYFACESINQMKIDDLQSFGVNTPVIFGLLDELGRYLTKQGEEWSAQFVERHKTYYDFTSLGSDTEQMNTIRVAAAQLFFAMHFIMQKMCPHRSEKKLKAGVAESIVDHTILDQLLRQSLIQECQPSAAQIQNGDVADQIKSFFIDVLNNVPPAEPSVLSAAEPQATLEPANEPLLQLPLVAKTPYRPKERVLLRREKVVSQRLSAQRVTRLRQNFSAQFGMH